MTAPSPDAGLRALQDADFSWAVRLQDIWTTAVGDVPEMHRNARNILLAEAGRLKHQSNPGNPLGWFLTGAGGTGKTHLLNTVQDTLVDQGFGFVLVDMTDVRDFWETVAQGYITSLQNILTNGRKQYAILIERMIGNLSAPSKIESNVRALAQRKSVRLKDDLDVVLKALARKQQAETLRYQDTVRALICLNSDDFEIANMGSSWLQGLDIDEALGNELRFQKKNQSPIEIVRSLSWLMSLTGPTVLAFDQLDPIVHQVARQTTTENLEEQNTARWIIDQIGNGLSALRETTTRTLVIVSCLEETYSILQHECLNTNLGRFHDAIVIRQTSVAEMESLVRGRLEPAYSKQAFVPPYPTWPFAKEAFAVLEQDTPRRILKLCDEHRRSCIQQGVVAELHTFGKMQNPVVTKIQNLDHLDRQFAELRTKADIPAILDEKNEDETLAQLYQAALNVLVFQKESLPDGIDAVVEKEFGGGKTNRPLHARLRLIMRNDNEREEHYCLRAIQKGNHAAFKTRLKAAITHAGIDRKLTFRKLTIIRRSDFPGGKETQQLTNDFHSKGGRFHKPGDEEIRTLFALDALFRQNDSKLGTWLIARKPLDAFKLADVLTAGSLLTAGGEAAVVRPDAVATTSGPSKPVTTGNTPFPPPVVPPVVVRPRSNVPADSALLLGQKLIGPDRFGESIGPPLNALAKHTVVLAGAGSGKTVLLYRLVEEAALRGIPSIVVDCANDLASFDEPKEASPHWREGDAASARQFHQAREMILWTPGKEGGNPLTLRPLPDFNAVKGDAEELADALLMANASLTEIVAKGTGEKAMKKTGILKRSLEFFARNYDGGTLGDYADMLKDLPDGAGPGVNKEKALAVEMADALRVQMTTNPLLNTNGSTLDPAVLFGDDRPRATTRISVISLIGLSTLDMQRTFLNQLAMILFSWIKKNPNPPDRPLRGLLVIDEAKDFVPAQRSTECKESMLRLGAQARKYGLGLVFATQHPKDIEHKLIGNSATHFYGLNSSPASLATLQEQMRLKGGNGDDIARLKVGQFYYYSAGSTQTPPIKVQVPDSLSTKRLMEEQEILAKAKQSRRLLNGKPE